jgi:hypothetical protein
LPLPLLLLRAAGGGGKGWLHAPLPVIGMDSNGNGNCNCLREKGVGQGGGGRGGIEDGFIFSCIVFFAYPFQRRSTDFVSSSSQLLDGLLLQDFSSSRPNLVITFPFGNYSVRINSGK